MEIEREMDAFKEGNGGILNVAIGQPPTDCTEAGLAELERELDGCLYASDNWVYEYEPAGSLNWDRVGRLIE